MSNRTIIGLTGKMCSGKSHVADTLFHRSKLGVEGGIIPFAKPLKSLARDFFGWDGQKDERGRKLLQVLGTEVGREYGGWDFWIKKWKLEIEKFQEEIFSKIPKNWQPHTHLLIIVDDVRFSNEAEEIINLGGKVFEVVNKALDSNDNHISEGGIDLKYVTRMIDNTGYSLTEQRIVEIFSEYFPSLYRRKE